MNFFKIFTVFFLILANHQIWAQNNYRLSNFKLLQDAIIIANGSQTKGLDIQFAFSPTLLDDVEYKFSADIKYKDHSIAQQNIKFTYTYTDSIAYLVDSLGMDSVGNLDTIVHFYIPYRAIDIEEGNHDVIVSISIEGKALPIYNRPHQIQQIKIYDLFLDLKSAIVVGDSTVSPIKLNYYAPDPKWVIKVGVDEILQGTTTRDIFKLGEKSFSFSITNEDSIEICVYDADPSINDFLACYKLEHGSENFEKKYSFVNFGEKVKDGQFSIQKIERKPVATDFKVTEEFDYRGIKGLKLDFNYNLPLQYKRRNISIKITNEQQAGIDNIIELNTARSQKDNRIVGSNSYFIAYYNLQKTKRVKLVLSGNEKIIEQHLTNDLRIEKTIDSLSLEQTAGYLYKGVSGILYELDFYIPKLPNNAQLKLKFPNLASETLAELFYWEISKPDKIYKGNFAELPSVNKHRIAVFLPYFVAPQRIRLTPQITLETVDIPSIVLTSFETKEYNCPAGLNDIEISATKNELHQFSGLSGQLFSFTTNIPEYYHSKGNFNIEILENGTPINKGFFINQDAEMGKKATIYSQKKMEVFIPYRFMKNGANYEVVLQAQSQRFALSEARSEKFSNSSPLVQNISLYLQKMQVKDWTEIVYKIGIRNNKNPNSTYEHLGYQIVFQDTVKNNYKADIPPSANFSVALHDEIVIWIKDKNMRDDEAVRLTTSIQGMVEQKNVLELKNQAVLKQVIFKLVQKP